MNKKTFGYVVTHNTLYSKLVRDFGMWLQIWVRVDIKEKLNVKKTSITFGDLYAYINGILAAKSHYVTVMSLCMVLDTGCYYRLICHKCCF